MRRTATVAALLALLAPFAVALLAHLLGTTPERLWSAIGASIGFLFGLAVLVGCVAQLVRR